MPLPIPTLLQRSLYVLVLALFALSCETTSPAEKKNYRVSFDLNGTTGSITPQTIAEGEKVAKPIDPTRDGFTFVDWYTDEATTQAYDFATPITANLTLYAKWTADAVETFTVSFNTKGGSAVASLTVTKDGKVDPPDNPTKEGYAFDGWCTDEATTQAYDFTTATVTATITLYAKWGEKLVSIPDANFRAALQALVGDAFEGDLLDRTHSSVLTLDSLAVGEKNITSLEGIEHFTALDTLFCHNNLLTKLDVSKNTALTTLGCWNNQLTRLDVSNNTALTRLYCSDNQLIRLDVSSNTALRRLFCVSNQLTELNLSNNTALATLYCASNQLTTLDISINTALIYLSCWDNQLTRLDVSSNTALDNLFCRNNSLTELDISKNTALTWLTCDQNQLSRLDVSSNTALTRLYCDGNQLSRLDLRGIKSFTRLVIDAGVSVDGTATNPLTELYVHTALQTHGEVKEAKTNLSADIAISTYDDANARVCADFDPTEGTAGTCKD